MPSWCWIGTDTAFSYNRTTFADEAAFLKFVAETRDRSLYDTPVQVEAGVPYCSSLFRRM